MISYYLEPKGCDPRLVRRALRETGLKLGEYETRLEALLAARILNRHDVECEIRRVGR